MSELFIKPTEELNWRNGRGYGHTTLLETMITDYTGGGKCIEKRQYSKMLREFVDYTKPYIEQCDRELFEKTFNLTLEKLIFDLGKEPNSNFSLNLFADDSFMNSSLYKSNENHLLELFDGPEGSNKYICAVYIDEIIWVMKTIVDVIYEMLGVELKVYIEFEDKKQRIDTLPEDNPRVELITLSKQLSEISAKLNEISLKL